MYQIELYLPLYNNDKKAFPTSHYESVKQNLSDKFGGITMYSRTPVIGLWKESQESIVKDDLVIYEIISEKLDESFWQEYKFMLQSLFQQEAIIIKSSKIKLL